MNCKTLTKGLILQALFLSAMNLHAQGTLEDYQRAYSLYGKFNATQVYDELWDRLTEEEKTEAASPVA